MRGELGGRKVRAVRIAERTRPVEYGAGTSDRFAYFTKFVLGRDHGAVSCVEASSEFYCLTRTFMSSPGVL